MLQRRSIPTTPIAVRHASSYQSAPRRFLSTTILLGGTAALIAYYYDSRSALHEHVAMPLIRLLADAEMGHKLSIRLLAGPSWMRPRDKGVDGEELQAEVRYLCRATRETADL
jgi:dihydroorotate dehydrogenase